MRELLLARDFDGIVEWIRQDRHALRSISASLFDSDRLVCWRAIEALGKVAPLVADRDIEKVRVLVRRLLWQMNDESGNVGWYSAEAVGEIAANVPQVIPEYANILISFLVEEPFERGAAWAIWRMAGVSPWVYRTSIDGIAKHITDADPFIRAHLYKALMLIDREAAQQHTSVLASDATAFTYYDLSSGDFVETTVAEAALETEGATTD